MRTFSGSVFWGDGGWSLELWWSTWAVISCAVLLRRGLLGLLVSGTSWPLELNCLNKLSVSGTGLVSWSLELVS